MPLPLITDGCLEWHSVCNAECCRQYTIETPREIGNACTKGDEIIINKPLNQDVAWYYKLHGARYVHGETHIKLDKFAVTGNRLTVFRKCGALTDELKCKYHGTPQQPKICADPKVHEPLSAQPSNVGVTPNCIIRFREDAKL